MIRQSAGLWCINNLINQGGKMDMLPREVMIAHQSAAEDRIRERELAEFDRALQQDIRIRIIGTVFIVLLVVLMAVFLPASARAANTVIEEYVPLSRDLLPIELVAVDTERHLLEKARQQLKQSKGWRLISAQDRMNYPGKCFITLMHGEVVVECAVGTHPDSPWVLLERPRRTLAPRVFKSVSDAIATIRNFSRHSLKDHRLEKTI